MTVSGASTDAAWVAGGYKDEDEHMGDYYWAMEASHGFWEPQAWHKSPVQLREEARAMNMAAFASAARAAPQHSNPPAHTALRPF